MTELEAYCKEEGAGIPGEVYERHVVNYQRRLMEVIENKGHTIDY